MGLGRFWDWPDWCPTMVSAHRCRFGAADDYSVGPYKVYLWNISKYVNYGDLSDPFASPDADEYIHILMRWRVSRDKR